MSLTSNLGPNGYIVDPLVGGGGAVPIKASLASMAANQFALTAERLTGVFR